MIQLDFRSRIKKFVLDRNILDSTTTTSPQATRHSHPLSRVLTMRFIGFQLRATIRK